MADLMAQVTASANGLGEGGAVAAQGTKLEEATADGGGGGEDAGAADLAAAAAAVAAAAPPVGECGFLAFWWMLVIINCKLAHTHTHPCHTLVMAAKDLSCVWFELFHIYALELLIEVVITFSPFHLLE
jgi:hypothetical protein